MKKTKYCNCLTLKPWHCQDNDGEFSVCGVCGKEIKPKEESKETDPTITVITDEEGNLTTPIYLGTDKITKIGIYEAYGKRWWIVKGEESKEIQTNDWNITHNGEPCYYCGKPVDNLSANPSQWGIPLCHSDEPGKVKPHHIGCVSSRLEEIEKLKKQVYQYMGGDDDGYGGKTEPITWKEAYEEEIEHWTWAKEEMKKACEKIKAHPEWKYGENSYPSSHETIDAKM